MTIAGRRPLLKSEQGSNRDSRDDAQTAVLAFRLFVLLESAMLESLESEVEKSVKMPSQEEMARRLKVTSLPLRQPGVLTYFISSVADQVESGSSLVAAWEGACQEANKKLARWKDLTITQLLHCLSFPGVIDAVTPDREVAKDAKEELDFLEEIRA